MTGMQIKLARTSKRIKQLELAAQTQIRPNRLSAIENEWVQPTPEEAAKISQALALDRAESDQVENAAAESQAA
jgi:transcriptional regulator with XRE-family HTH domain